MLRRLTLCAALALAAPAAAQQGASMSADDAYVRSVKYTQDQYGKLSGDNAELKALLTTALAKLKDLETRAKANDATAKSTLNDFAQGNTAKGVDALFVQAKAKAENSAAAAKAAAEDYKAAGAIAFASDTGRAVTAYEAALKLAPGDFDALRQLAWLYQRRGELDKVVRNADQLIASVDPLTQSYGYMLLANAARTRGDLAAGEAAYRAGLALATMAGLKNREAAALQGLGLIAQTRGDLAAAEANSQRALAVYDELGDQISRENKAGTLGNLGEIARIRGDLAAAEDYQKRALALHAELGSKQGQAYALNSLGAIAKDRGNIASACDYFRKSLALSEAMGAPNSVIGNAARDNIAQYCPR